MLKFPTQDAKQINQDPRRLLLVAQSKVGKTSLIQTLPSCLNIDLNDSAAFYGGKYIDVRQAKEDLREKFRAEGKDVEPTLLQAYGYVVSELKKAIADGKVSYDYIAVDTMTDLEEIAKEYGLLKYKQAPMGKSFKGDDIYTLPNGAGYGWVRNAFKELYDMLNGCYKKGIIFIAHVKDASITKGGKELSAMDINLTGKLKLITAADMDAIGFMYRDKNGTDNILSFKGSERMISIGSRCSHLNNQEFIISTLNEDQTLTTHWDKVYQNLNK